MLIMVNSNNNNNKFYHIILEDGNKVTITYGRVGTDGVTRTNYGGISEFNKKVREKERKGYKEAEVITNTETSTSVSNANLFDIAMKQIKADKESKDFIQRLINKNIHQIVSSTTIKYDKKTGLFMTPLGAITLNGIYKAKRLLNDIVNSNSSYRKTEYKEHLCVRKSTQRFRRVMCVRRKLKLLPERGILCASV
jgi:predicted DNA-binding WGR domain protein